MIKATMSNNKQSSVGKEFVSYEEALALKELGFNEPCYKYIYIGDTGINVDHYLEVVPSKARNYNEDSLSISQPTYSQAFRWFRDEVGICHLGLLKLLYLELFERDMTYEDAELECLKRLIKIYHELYGGHDEQ